MPVLRSIILVALLAVLAGCAGGRPSRDRAPVVHDDVPATPGALPRAAGWFGDSADDVSGKAARCHMLRTALADTTHSWLWLELDLSGDASVRVSGPGALVFVLATGDVVREVRDAGLFVALSLDANTFLNSTSGPITIRSGHATAGSGCVRLLARLPAVDTRRTVVDHVSPVPGRWIQK